MGAVAGKEHGSDHQHGAALHAPGGDASAGTIRGDCSMTVYRSTKSVRDYLLGPDDAARTLRITRYRLERLVQEGFIVAGSRKGFFRLGHLIDGYAEAVRMGTISPADERQRAVDVISAPAA